MKKHLSLILIACMLHTACSKLDDNEYSAGSSESTVTDDIIKISSVSPGAVPADTMTTSTITLQLTKDAAAANRTISVSTTLGNFVNGQKNSTVAVNASGIATFLVKSSEPGTATVTATIKGISVTGLVVFQPAYPEDLLCSTDRSVMDTTQSAVVTAALFRNAGHGIVSNPQKVNFSISGVGSEQLTLPDFAFSNSGSASVTVANPSKITGTFVVTAKTLNAAGETLSKKITIRIN